MSEKGLDFSMPSPVKEKKESCRGTLVLVLMQVITLLALAVLYFSRGSSLDSVSSWGKEELERQLQLAQLLERQGLARPAAAAWSEYIRNAKPDREKEAKLWYRVGVIFQEGRLYEDALANFYRSDSVMKVPVLEVEITRRSQQCLEALGKAAGLRRNLEDRTAVPGSAPVKEVTLVEIGDWKITREDVEALAEEAIDRQLAGSGLPADQVMARKKEMLGNITKGDMLMGVAGQYVSEELLYRAALDDKLNEDMSVREEIMRTERGILASSYMRKAMSGLTASESEVRDFYLANPGEFTVLAAVRVAHIELPSEDRAQAAMKSLQGGEDFANLAKLLSADTATAEKGGEVPGWIDANSRDSWKREAARAILADKAKPGKGELLSSIVKGEKAWHVVRVLERRAESVRDLKDKKVAEDARNMLLDRKGRERQGQIFQELSARYKVIWHNQGPQPKAVEDKK